MNTNLNVILGVEAMCGVQGIEFHAPLQTSPTLQNVINVLRSKVPTLGADRYMAPSLEAASEMVAAGALTDAVQLPAFVQGRAD